MKWITIKELSKRSGYTEDAIRSKIKNGIWLEDIHWVKAPDGRILMNHKAIELWVEGQAEFDRVAEVSK